VTAAVDLGTLGFERGGHLLVERALTGLAVGERLAVRGRAADLPVHLRAWARARGHAFEPSLEAPAATQSVAGILVRGPSDLQRWTGAVRAAGDGGDEVAAHAEAHWGLAARTALVEAGVPDFGFDVLERDVVWADDAAALYRDAAAAQWDPETAIPWDAPLEHPAEIEDALVQVLTYLIENEAAALVVPARFCARIHPHFREVLQVLAIQVADEARHVAVFTRRARLRRPQLGTSTVGGQTSLKTLVDETDFALASFLLSVLGEGSFLTLLGFLHVHAPDACTAEIMRLAARDEARHVAFGMAHLQRHAAREPALRARLAAAVVRRGEELARTAGLNADVFDALLLLAAGGYAPADLERGYAAVDELVRQMDAGRRARLVKLGFDEARAAELSALHTRNFM
jgi:hypothetical protein